MNFSSWFLVLRSNFSLYTSFCFSVLDPRNRFNFDNSFMTAFVISLVTKMQNNDKFAVTHMILAQRYYFMPMSLPVTKILP